jgi:uncharacterized protein (TIGR00266 family)
MEQRILGTTLPVLEFRLDPGDVIVSVAGELAWKSPSVAMRSSTAVAGSGGLFGLVRRVAGGGSLFMTEFSPVDSPGLLAFATKVPGAILPVEISPGKAAVVNRHGFLCATRGVEVGVALQLKLGAGIFGGEGFVLQKVSGLGQAWIGLSGEVVTYDLEPGQSLRVHPGHVGMFEESVQLDVTLIRGIRNMLFGGDGIFLCHLTGPGRVWLQSLPVPDFAHAIAPYLPQDRLDAINEEHEEWPAEEGLAVADVVEDGEAAVDADGGTGDQVDQDDFHEGDAESTTEEGAFEETAEAS